MLHPETFFNLEHFSYKSLFLSRAPVWETLRHFATSIHLLSLGQIDVPIPPSTFLTHSEVISIGKGTVIEQGVVIQGPCVIGQNCTIRQGAYIRGPVLIGDRCIIGHASEIKSSILLNDCKVPHFNYVGNSILGNHVNLGAGAICANVRLDRQEVVVQIEEIRYKTGMQKFGGILGDGSQIGCHSVINPGILLRKNSRLRPLTSVQKSNLKEAGV